MSETPDTDAGGLAVAPVAETCAPEHRLCVHPGVPNCAQPVDGLPFCTREKGHAGNCVPCGTHTHNIKLTVQSTCLDCARLRAVNAELTTEFQAMREDRNMFRAQTADLLSILKAVRPWLAKAVESGVFSECVRPSGGAIIQSRIEAAIKEAEAAQ